MKTTWDEQSLNDLCVIRNGLWKGERQPFVHVGVIRNTNFGHDGILDDSEIAYLDVEQRKFVDRRLEYGDIILEKSGGGPKQPVGRVSLFNKSDGDFSFSNFTFALRVKDQSRLDFRFLHKFFYWLHVSGVTEAMQNHSTGIRNLDLGAYKKLLVPLPSLLEQRRIVEMLDSAFESIAVAKINTERNITAIVEMFESYRSQVINVKREGWVEKTLSDVCDYLNGKAHEPFIENNGKFKVVNARFIASGGSTFKRSNRALSLLSAGDIAMVLSDVPNGKALAKCYVVEQDDALTL